MKRVGLCGIILIMIKNIIFDVDGVLVDIHCTYTEFLKNTYPKFRNITSNDLSTLFPIHTDDGAIKLPDEFLADFRTGPYYSYRPLFDDTMAVLAALKKKGLKLFTLSAAGNPDKKLKWLSAAFGDIFDGYEFSPAHQSKKEALNAVVEKYALNKAETVFVDDRIYQVRAGVEAGLCTVRMESVLSLPMPVDLKGVPVVKSMTELGRVIDRINSDKDFL